jgi:hypothetical protein
MGHGDKVGHHNDDHKNDHVEHHDGDKVTHHSAHDDEEKHKQDDYHHLDRRLDKVTARLEHIDDGLDHRLNPKHRQKARSLAHRIHKLEGTRCDKAHYDCGGDDNECVSRLVVCDGIKDCRNGDDEKHCELPTHSGDKFHGKVVYDRCTQRHPKTMDITITAVKRMPAFTAVNLVRANFHISAENHGEEIDVDLPTVGYYRYATQNLVLLPPEDDNLALICDFDGANPDMCVGDIVYQDSLKACARFVFHRVHHDDHKDAHHDDHNDHKHDHH